MLRRAKQILHIQTIKDFYTKYEGRIGGITLVFGFIVDNLTVNSVTFTTQAYIFAAYIIIGGIAITTLHYLESREGREYPRLHFWFFLLFQFAIGSLFSMYFAFYSRGVSIATSWPFLLILLLTMIGSELWKKHYLRLSLQVSLYFVAIFSLCIYALPAITHELSTRVFIFGGLASLILIAVFVRLLMFVSVKRVAEWRGRILIGVGSLYLLLNILYFTNIIPPVPLTMRQFGVHHSLHWDGISKYIVTTEEKPWWNFLVPFPTYHHSSGDPVYVLASVYAPTSLSTTIVHEWQQYEDLQSEWITRSTVRVPIVGGRENGYRTYSMKQVLEEGIWRVNVKTATGLTIGRLRFSIVESDTTFRLKRETY